MRDLAMLVTCSALGLLLGQHAFAAPFAHEEAPLTIDVGALIIGSVVEIEVTGAQSYERVYLLQSTSGEGPGACPGLFGGKCLSIMGASLYETTWTEIDGTAARPLTVPASDGTELCIQAGIQRGAGNAFSELSNVVCHTIGFDGDGDGVPDAEDACEGFDDAIDGDADGLPDACDPFPDCVGEDLGCGCGEPGPMEYYEDADGDGVGAGDPIPFCEDEVPLGETCASRPYIELVDGDVEVLMDCDPGDYDCQARAMCESITGLECTYQSYDCHSGGNGSYYPVGTPGSSSFNFAINYDFAPIGNVVEEGGSYGGYGNICCGDSFYCDDYGIRQDHSPAGSGHWGLDADGIGAITGLECGYIPAYVLVDGDPCPDDPTDAETDGDGVCDSDDACPGSDDAIDADGDGTPDGCDPCPVDPADFCVPACTSLPYVEMVSGDISVPLDCAPGDYDCQAQAICEFITGVDCIYQSYDCHSGGNGSYYPVGTPGSSSFNFAINYDFAPIGNIVEEGGTYGGYGNICCGDSFYCDDYGIRQDHSPAGSGHWGLDADGADCL